jgi:hypothetical protein
MRTRWPFLWALVILASVCPLHAQMVCAVIPAANSELASVAGTLLESELGAAAGLRLVSRAEIQAVLTEQIFSAAMGGHIERICGGPRRVERARVRG